LGGWGGRVLLIVGILLLLLFHEDDEVDDVHTDFVLVPRRLLLLIAVGVVSAQIRFQIRPEVSFGSESKTLISVPEFLKSL